MDILKCSNLTRIYGTGGGKTVALNHVRFSVQKGEFVAIVGPSGSGKSTLLHLLGGVDRPSEGTVEVGGTDLYTLDEDKLAIFRRRHIGLVYQFYNLIPVLTAEENIVLPFLLDSRKVDTERLNEILSYLHLEDRRTFLPSQLSGGQQQRVSIGRALFTHPSLLLCDEPTGNLDRKNSEEIVSLLKESNRRFDQTVILITHDERIALQADRMLYMEDGQILRDEMIRQPCVHSSEDPAGGLSGVRAASVAAERPAKVPVGQIFSMSDAQGVCAGLQNQEGGA
ncbi:MAG TPA: peptide ABC transporter ATP-binding protein [Lachnospiraceae bacterium]|nr:peptide ABC transporter ATP-binding protein [Lachnospiraceae bacterium]